MRALPLRLRVPNPPPVFIGREAELDWVRDAVVRGPVTVVSGPGGAGKSSLVLRAMHRELPAKVSDALFLTVGATAPVFESILGALAEAERVSHVDWRDLRRDPSSLLALAIDLAEQNERTVILDETSPVGGDTLAELVGQLAGYARRSRWIVTTRGAPSLDGARSLDGQRLELGPMSEGELARVAELLDGTLDADQRRRLAIAADGSPWRLRRLATGGIARSRIDALSSIELERVRALSALEIEAPIEVLHALAGVDERDADELERLGLVERGSSGLRLHARARELVAPPSAGDLAFAEGEARAAEVLAHAESPDALVEGLRLALRSGRDGLAARIVEERGDALFGAGFAPRLHALLARHRSAELDLARIRVALATDDPVALASLDAPREDDARARLAWATVHLARGELGQAVVEAERARAAAAAAEGDVRVAFEAAILHARVLMNLGQHREALAILDALDPSNDAERAERDTHVAVVSGQLGDLARLRAAAARVERSLDRVQGPRRIELARGVALALFNAGRLRDAARVLDEWLRPGPTSSPAYLGRLVPYLRACLAIDRGELDRADAELDALAPYVGPLLSPYYANARALAALLRGACEEAEGWIASPLPVDASASLRDERNAVRLAARIVQRLPDDATPAPESESAFATLLALRRARLDLHLGVDPTAAITALPETNHPELSLLSDIVEAEAALVEGRHARAAELALDASRRTEELGYVALSADALQIACEGLLLMDDARRLEPHLCRLEALAAALPSDRYEAVAAWMRAVVARDVDALELTLASASVAPDVAARARALLGDDPPASALDRRIVAGLAAQSGWRAPRVLGDCTIDAWRIDLDRGRVGLSGGRTVDLSRHPLLFKILGSLAARGGRADKEALVTDVWAERSYHPLRHDNRLHAAVRKLRLRLEDDPRAPARLVTTEEGYALAGKVRVVGVGPSVVSGVASPVSGLRPAGPFAAGAGGPGRR